DLYRISISEGKAQVPVKLDSDVSTVMLQADADGNYVYFKDYDYAENSGTLYFNGEKVDSDAYPGYTIYANGILYYCTDYRLDKSYGTLMYYAEGKSEKIADDVYDYNFTANGDMLYLYDYSTNSDSGALYRYRKGKATKLDEDVIAILPVSTGPANTKGVRVYGYQD
ncbi:MAG: hypothetical protein LBM60_08865, partial [Clostridium sp.]|nr:hypothetical protein [Clostridium sp.]